MIKNLCACNLCLFGLKNVNDFIITKQKYLIMLWQKVNMFIYLFDDMENTQKQTKKKIIIYKAFDNL